MARIFKTLERTQVELQKLIDRTTYGFMAISAVFGAMDLDLFTHGALFSDILKKGPPVSIFVTREAKICRDSLDGPRAVFVEDTGYRGSNAVQMNSTVSYGSVKCERYEINNMPTNTSFKLRRRLEKSNFCSYIMDRLDGGIIALQIQKYDADESRVSFTSKTDSEIERNIYFNAASGEITRQDITNNYTGVVQRLEPTAPPIPTEVQNYIRTAQEYRCFL